MAHKNMPCVYWQEGDRCSKFTDDEYDSFCVLGPCSAMCPSNADRIRAMSDEELEKAITDRSSVCPRGRYEGDYDCELFEDCHACWLDWLKSPVEVVDNARPE